jgi:hypothetical protein
MCCGVGGCVKLPNGYVMYRGPSMLTGEAIVLVVIRSSVNPKTGDMAQTYILRDGMRPVEALRSGEDKAICGDCKHRAVNAGTCYVVVRQGASRVHDSLERGFYPDFTHCPDLLAELLQGRRARLGTYGDPAAVPVDIWREFTAPLAGWVGYTHQWRRADAQPLREFCMASVDSPAEMAEARSMGWRTFRVRLSTDPLEQGEAVCPASKEGGFKLQCDGCGACDGKARDRRGGIAIMLHGNHLEDRAARFADAAREQELAA